MWHGERIVIGFDGSALAHMAVSYVARRAGPGDVIVIVHACRETPSYGRGRLDDDGDGEHRRARGWAILETALSPTDPSPRARHLLELRDELPASALVGAADEHGAELIVLGATGVGSVERGLGSVVAGVLDRSERPVLVVPRSHRGLV